jgi:arylsulfatase A-like enzyme
MIKKFNTMKRRILLLFFSLWAITFCHAQKSPNIVFILIDDMGWKDVSYMGSSYYETPHIDKLAKQGMSFTNAYANSANCAPTRASLLSGQYNPRHGVFTVGNADRGKTELRRLIPIKNSTTLPLDKITIAEALKPAGYVSAAIGKWHIGNTPTVQGFDVGVEKPQIDYGKGHFNKQGEYLTDRLTDEAVGFIKENKDKPFFLYLAHHAVHTPIQAKKDIIAAYKDKEGVGCHNDATYAAMIQSVDESVGRVHETLEELGLSDNTMILFFSDNGGYGPKTCMRPLRGGKGMYYEGGIREPMFVYWPEKVKAGTSSDTPVMSTDFYPTFLEIAGADAPKDYTLDGLSIMSLLEGKKKLKREKLYWHFPGYLQAYNGLKEDSRDPDFRTRPVSVIRKGDWKLLMFHEEWMLDGGRKKMASNNAVELYNLKTDLSESNNLSNTNKKKRDELLDDLMNWQKEIDAQIPSTPNPEYKSN